VVLLLARDLEPIDSCCSREFGARKASTLDCCSTAALHLVAMESGCLLLIHLLGTTPVRVSRVAEAVLKLLRCDRELAALVAPRLLATNAAETGQNQLE